MSKQLAAHESSDLEKAFDAPNLKKLFLIEVTGIKDKITTSSGTAENVPVANIWVVHKAAKDGTYEYSYIPAALVFPKVIAASLRKCVGEAVQVGRLTQGEKQPGKNAPWLMAKATEDDMKKASAFWSWYALNGSSSSAIDEDDADDSDDNSNDEGGDDSAF